MKSTAKTQARQADSHLHKRRRALTLVLSVTLVALVVVVYLPVWRCGLIWDDDSYVTENPTLREQGGLLRIWTELGATPQFYPLVFTTYWLEYRLWGLKPAGYHAVNVALHALAAVLLWRVLLLLGLPGPVAWFGAAVFAVHPVHVESVAWITERKNVLSGVFYLGALLTYARYCRLGHVDEHNDALPGQPHQLGWYAAALVFFIAALLSKTVTASLPAAILLLIWWKRGRVTRHDIVRLVPFFVVGIAFGLLTVWVERHHVGAVGEEWDLSPVERVLIAGRAVWFYAAKLVWPARLTFIYPRWQIDSGMWWQYLYPAGVLAVICALWLARGRIGRGPLVAVLLFAGTLVPALGFFNTYPMRYSFVADHFQYLASIGMIVLAAAIAWSVVECGRASWLKPAAAVAMATVVLALATLTWRQVHVYRDAETLWRDTLAKNPDAWIARNNLGVIYLERRELDRAGRSFARVLQARPHDVRTHNNIGSLLLMRGDVERAIGHFETAITHEPDFVGARLNLVKTLFARRRYEEANEHFLHALSVDPNVAKVQNALGLLLLTSAPPEVATKFFDRATGIVPDWTLLINERAWILATATDPQRRDAEQSVRLATRAAEQSDPSDPNILDTLAAAYAGAGDFERAQEVAARALELARRQKDTTLAKEIESRLALYRRGEPYRQTPNP